jgi:hypothetical protein
MEGVELYNPCYFSALDQWRDVYDIDSDQDETDKTRSAAVMARAIGRVATAQTRP